MKLEANNYYNEDSFSKEEYTATQIERHRIKKDKRRISDFYLDVSKIIKKLKAQSFKNSKMICLGTRNNWERDFFRESLGSRIHSNRAF